MRASFECDYAAPGIGHGQHSWALDSAHIPYMKDLEDFTKTHDYLDPLIKAGKEEVGHRNCVLRDVTLLSVPAHEGLQFL